MTDDPIRYAETRLGAMVDHGWPDYPFLLGDIRDVLADLARLRTDLDGTIAERDKARRNAAAEEAARKHAEADSAAYRRIIDVLSRAGDVASVRGIATTALAQFRPGAALLAELEAARTVVKEARVGWTKQLEYAIAAYDEAVKERET